MKLDAYVRKGRTPNSPSPRLMDWLETWYHERAEANLRPNSRRSYEHAIVRLNRIAGARRINSLGHKDMAAIQVGLKCYSPKTATITWSVLKNALEAARDENLIRRNPTKMVRPVSASSSSLKVNPPSLPDDG
ncbi:phage integrase [Bifidobacterium longum subsp. longum]|nr:phage integrase [Bifidobacterium longum subsp. longum]